MEAGSGDRGLVWEGRRSWWKRQGTRTSGSSGRLCRQAGLELLGKGERANDSQRVCERLTAVDEDAELEGRKAGGGIVRCPV